MLKSVPRTRRWAAVLGAAAVLAAPLPAYAHDAVLDSNPKDGAVVKEFPSEVSLEFSGLIKPDFNTFALTDLGSGEQILTGEPTVDGQVASLPVPENKRAGEGKYQLGYQITSSDGHATRGKIVFEVSSTGDVTPSTAKPEAKEEASASKSQDANADTEQTSNFGLFAGIAAAVMLLGVLVVAVKKRRDL
ncbi:copper resistance CopC family protein [Corynebacterium gerontici]|uniref:CopC domain-containing protein n=1 Tax=Corynebacterium gerontici TaxID=2079234 RepID=A0A3G6J0S5_9CORY|nr:copper resistance CopC family protein [Corynebacterium gerontici]AZA11562.1 hypothetical protein CGERO_06275 [Corynebacterium gerontici]